jgi:hypothetical protein
VAWLAVDVGEVVALDVERLGEDLVNACFQHAACSGVVDVSTPSRSKRTASKGKWDIGRASGSSRARISGGRPDRAP